jgi:hypothetical protein
VSEAKNDPAWPEFVAWADTLGDTSTVELKQFAKSGEPQDADSLWVQLHDNSIEHRPPPAVEDFIERLLNELNPDAVHPQLRDQIAAGDYLATALTGDDHPME